VGYLEKATKLSEIDQIISCLSESSFGDYELLPSLNKLLGMIGNKQYVDSGWVVDEVLLLTLALLTKKVIENEKE
jgi:hypothetical protein